jgi:hypothetical protein
MPPSEPYRKRVQCPHCGTVRLRILSKLDPIERLHGNRLLNRVRAWRGDTLYHCIYCRLQFYHPHNIRRTGEDDSCEEASPASDTGTAEVDQAGSAGLPGAR